jgi:tetratricopeptide (TPR) repeat protein
VSDDRNGRFTRRDIFRGTFLGLSKAAGRDLEAEQAAKEDRQALAAAEAALASGDEAAAEGHLSAYLKRNSSRSDVRRDYAFCLYRQGKHIQSRVELVRLVRSAKADNHVLAFLFLAQIRTGHKAKAAQTLQSIRDVDPEWTLFIDPAQELLRSGAPDQELIASMEATLAIPHAR